LVGSSRYYLRNGRISSRTTRNFTSGWENPSDHKSLYGDRVANLAWDETQSAWLTSDDIGFQRLPSDGSIYIKRTDGELIVVLNAVDDQLYFATDPNLKAWFEQATTHRFDVQTMGQATWYLQSRITQQADFKDRRWLIFSGSLTNNNRSKPSEVS
jgi:Reverse transcriptase (RNA-dependent DNA polymerase)